jgi:uncharacterized alpha-E superfamily protein
MANATDIAKALDLLITLTEAATNTMVQMAAISALIQKAQAENRTTFTKEEWATLDTASAAAKQHLADAITKAQAGG